MRSSAPSKHGKFVSCVGARFGSWFEKFVLGLLCFSTGLLSLVTVIFTVRVPYNVSSYDIGTDRIVPTLMLLVLFAASVSLLWKALEEASFSAKTLAAIAFTYAVILSVLWNFVANTDASWDQLDCIKAASCLLGSTDPTDLVKWAPFDYIDRFPFQMPLVYFFAGLIQIAGDRVFMFMGILNSIANGVSFALIVLIAEELYHDKKTTLITLLICMSFFGLILYATYAYGNLISIPFALYAFYGLFTYGNSETPRKAHVGKHLVLGLLSLGISILFKSTMKIAAIAYAITFVILAAKRRRIALVPLLLIPIVLSNVVMSCLTADAQSRFGDYLTTHQVPSTSWLIMGTGGGREINCVDNSQTKPGWFDSYVWARYDELGYSSMKELNSDVLKKELQTISNNPIAFVSFMSRKVISEWAEPTYESFVASNFDNASLPPKARAGRDYTRYGASAYYGKINTALSLIMDFAQSAIMLGALYAFVHQLKSGKSDFNLIALPLVFLGGAAVYLLWEMKSQYILQFYLMLIPAAAYGWTTFLDAFVERPKAKAFNSEIS